MGTFTAQHLLHRTFLGSIRSGTLCAPIPLSKNFARKNSRERAQVFHRAKQRVVTKELVIKRLFIWRAGWSIVAMRLFLPSVAVAQVTAPSPAGIAEVERIIVTGSNIPTAEEVGPNPVDTYRPAEIEKLGIRNATDLQTFLPQGAGSTVNLNIGGNGGDGTVQFNLRGLLPKETLVLVDGKRVALGSLNAVGFSGPVASSVPIGTCPVTHFKSPGEEAIFAAATSPAQLALLVSA